MKFIAICVIVALCVTYAHCCTQSRSYSTLKQCNTAWGSKTLGSSTTICASGCAVCSVASAIAGIGRTINGATATCDSLNTYLRNNGGYSGNSIIWSAVSPFGLTYDSQTTSIATIQTAICNNRVVILNVRNGGHWVLATGYSGNTFYVMDPGYTVSSYASTDVVKASIYRV